MRRYTRLPVLLAVAAAAALAACNDRSQPEFGAARSDERAAQPRTPAEQPGGPGIATNGIDARITAAVKAVLARDPQLASTSIEVESVNGRVALSGTAPTASARERATEIAQGVRGVAAVDNRIMVTGG